MTTINLERLSKQLNHQKLVIIELASKGEIIFDHANKMIIQLNELQKVYQQIIETQKRPIFIPHEKDTTLSRENINRLLVTLRGYSSEGQSVD
jgi:hypothetical protein